MADKKTEKKRKRPVFAPPIDILEKKGEFKVWADVPGADPQSMEIKLEGDFLTVSASPAPPDVAGLPLLYREYVEGEYEASFRLSPAVDREKITAELKDGVLTLTLAKAEAVKLKKIEIKAA